MVDFGFTKEMAGGSGQWDPDSGLYTVKLDEAGRLVKMSWRNVEQE